MENSTSTARASIVGLDVVELAVTCFAAALIMVAVGLLLFYFCTTPRQRERHCRRCARTRHSVEQIQTAPTSWKDLKSVTNLPQGFPQLAKKWGFKNPRWGYWRSNLSPKQAEFSKLKFNIYNFNSLFTCRCSKEISSCCLNNVRSSMKTRRSFSLFVK